MNNTVIKTKKEEDTFQIPELVEIPNNIMPSAIISSDNNNNVYRKRKRSSILGDITNSNIVNKKARILNESENEMNESSEFSINDENIKHWKLNLENVPLINRVNILENDKIYKTMDDGKWKCKYCRKWILYENDENVIKHLSAHRLERKFKCKYCNKIFKRRADVVRHSRTHTGEKPHKCSICNKGFGTKYCLKTHLRIHTGELPYKCSFCGKQFRQNSHLTVHWRVHTGDKPYECKVCGKRFGQHSTLQVHHRIHQNGKPFICPCCPNKRDFTQRHSLQRHIKTVHKEYFIKYGYHQIQNLEKVKKLKKKAEINEKAKKEILGK